MGESSEECLHNTFLEVVPRIGSYDLLADLVRKSLIVLTQDVQPHAAIQEGQATASQPLRELQVWMLEHLQDKLSVEQLADRIGMSPRHLTRVCLREIGMNPGQLADRVRVQAAQQMIDSSKMGLKEIAEACGFRTADSMRRVFLRVLGVTAGDYSHRFRR